MSDTRASGDAFTFSAFMSYARHDRADAVRLQRRLEQYRLDADLRVREGERFFPARPLQPVFRDEDELVPGQDLPERIRRGLESSRFLIVLASRASLKSQWVEKEILDFMALGKAHRIIVLVIDGVPNAVKAGKAADQECLPRPFRLKHVDGRFTDEAAVEPNWVDWRGRRKNDRINFLRLVSALLGLDRFDDLVRRDARAQRNRLRFFQAASAVFVAVGLAAVGGAFLAADQLNEVRTTESKFLARLAGDLAEPDGDATSGDHARALQLAIEGAPTATNALYPRPFTVETEAALRRSTSHLRLQRFLAHDMKVRNAVLSPDGRRIATLSSNAPLEGRTVVRLWDATSGERIGRATLLRHHDFAEQFNIVFADNGSRFIAVAGETTLLFDGETGAGIGKPTVHAVKEVNARFSPDGSRVMIEGEIVRLRDARTGALIVEFAAGFANSDLTQVAEIREGELALFDVPTRTFVGPPIPYPPGAEGMGYSANGARFLLVNKDDVSVWDASTGARVAMWSVADPAAALFSADGTRVLTAARRGETQWRDASSGRPLAQPMRQPEPIGSVRFSPDGKYFATLSTSVVRVWDAATGAPVGKPMPHTPESLARVLFSGDGARLATLSETKLLLWNMRDGSQIGTTIDLTWEFVGAAFSPGGDRLMIAIADSVRLHDAATGAFLDTLKHEGQISSTAFSPDGTRLLTSSADSSARVWDVRHPTVGVTTITHSGDIDRLTLSRDGTLIATTTWNKEIRLWRMPAGAPVGAPMTHGTQVERVAFNADGNRLLSLGGGEAHLWDTKTGQRVGTLKSGAAATAAVFSADGKRVAIASSDGAARVVSAATAAPIGSALRHGQGLTNVSFSADGTRVLTTAGDGSAGDVRVWDLATARQVGRAMPHGGSGVSAVFNLGGDRVLTTPNWHAVQVWDARTGTAIGAAMEHPSEVFSAAFSSDGQRVLTVSIGSSPGSGMAHLWKADTGAAIVAMEDDSVSSARFSGDGSRIATASSDGRVRLWDGRTGTLLAAMRHGHSALPENFTFSADDRFIATSTAGVVRLWDGRTGAAIGMPLAGIIGEGSDAWAGDHRRIVTTERAVARVWDVASWMETGSPLIARACAALTATGIGPLPQNLRERAFRSKPTRGCADRGLLDWRFYLDR